MIYQTEETRENILRIAGELFLEQGFFETQMKDVAIAVGTSRNTLYRYFRDKGDLGFAILESTMNRFAAGLEAAIERERAADHADARELLIAILSEMFMGKAHENDLRFMAEFDAYFSGRRIPEDFSERENLSRWEPLLATLEAIVRGGMAEGSIRADLPPDRLLVLILNAIKVLQQQVLTRGRALFDVPEAVEDFVPTILRLLSDGLKPQTTNTN